jgi:hypothetical protein
LKYLKNKILVMLVIIVLLVLLTFIVYKLFFNKEQILSQDTFFLAFINEENGIEEVEHLFLIDVSKNNNSIQIIMIPTVLKCSLPGLSKMGFNGLYPFGGDSVILEAFFNKFGLNIGYFFTADAGYFNDLLKANSPITLDFNEDISFNDYNFSAGENILEKEAVISFLEYDCDSKYEKDFLENKSYIIREILDKSRTVKIKLLDMSSNNLRITNLTDSFINEVNTIFLKSSSEVYFYFMDPEPCSYDIAELKNIVIAGKYQELLPEKIIRFYPLAIECEPVEKVIEKAAAEEIKKENLILQILNGNYIPGSATETAKKVQELGYIVFEVGNFEEDTIYDNTLIYYKEGLEEFTLEIAAHLDIGQEYIEVLEEGKEGEADIIIIVGLDFGEE